MTTVIDPTGSAAVVYNRSGTTIVTMEGGLEPNPQAPIGNHGVDIPRLSETTILLSTIINDPNNGGYSMVYRLPSDADIGDVVEVYLSSIGPGVAFWAGPVIFPQIGESIHPQPVSTGTNTAAGYGAGGTVGWRYRKISSSQWVAIGTPS